MSEPLGSSSFSAPMVDNDEYDDNLLEEDDGTMTEIERSNDEAILTAKSFNENTE
jgi:hypothetical protein